MVINDHLTMNIILNGCNFYAKSLMPGKYEQ